MIHKKSVRFIIRLWSLELHNTFDLDAGDNEDEAKKLRDQYTQWNPEYSVSLRKRSVYIEEWEIN